jgi:hypothetical protein
MTAHGPTLYRSDRLDRPIRTELAPIRWSNGFAFALVIYSDSVIGFGLLGAASAHQLGGQQ